jgi:shikimate kinase
MFDLQGLNIYLIGMMGAGKSTIGKLLAANSDYAFLDTDDFVIKSLNQYEQKEGKVLTPDIAAIFEIHGEPEFRNIETRVIAEVSAHTRLIVATGGGMPVARENWNHLHQGFVIWIDPAVDLLVERLQGDTTRPILATPGELHPKLTRILAERSHMYAEADLRISFSDALLPETVVERIYAGIPTVLKTPLSIPD